MKMNFQFKFLLILITNWLYFICEPNSGLTTVTFSFSAPVLMYNDYYLN